MSDYVGNKDVDFPIVGRTNPALSVLGGKKYIIPYYIEVPMETTLAEVSKWVTWERPTLTVKKRTESVKPKKKRKKKAKSFSLDDPPAPTPKPRTVRRKKKGISLGD